jgi:hypothetical protein
MRREPRCAELGLIYHFSLSRVCETSRAVRRGYQRSKKLLACAKQPCAPQLPSGERAAFKHMDALAVVLAKRLRVTDATLDGELSAGSMRRPADLHRSAAMKEPCYLHLNGEDLRTRPLIEVIKGSGRITPRMTRGARLAPAIAPRREIRRTHFLCTKSRFQ